MYIILLDHQLFNKIRKRITYCAASLCKVALKGIIICGETGNDIMTSREMCLVRGLGARGPEFDSRMSHPCFNFFPFCVAYM